MATLAEAKAALKRHGDDLLAIPGVQGVGITTRAPSPGTRAAPCIVVYVVSASKASSVPRAVTIGAGAKAGTVPVVVEEQATLKPQ